MLRKKITPDPLKDFPELKSIPKDNYPQHVFIIPDGNRRYAKKKGKPKFWGHKEGFNVAIKLLRYFRPLPIKVITLWGLASDNFKRGKDEIENLMGIFELIIDKYLKELIENDSRFIHLGRKDRIPERLLNKIKHAEEITKNNKGQIICLALDYGGTDQDLRVLEKVKKLNEDVELNEELLWKLRDSEGLIRSADLIIRTSETRTSDAGWLNGKNSVLYFLPDKYFPEIVEKDLVNAIIYYSNTIRNEGA